MDLDAVHRPAARNGSSIGQAKRRDPDQHQLALERPRVDRARQHVGGGDEPRARVAREAQPDGRIRLSRDREAADRDVGDAVGADGQRDPRIPARHPEHLEREGRDERVTDPRDQRDTTHRAPLEFHVQQAVTGRRPVDLLQRAQ